ncbi:hypothetical protein QF010_006846, partial [Pseudomonas silensiensis]
MRNGTSTTPMLNVPTPSRASPLPQGLGLTLCSWYGTTSTNNVRAMKNTAVGCVKNIVQSPSLMDKALRNCFSAIGPAACRRSPAPPGKSKRRINIPPQTGGFCPVQRSLSPGTDRSTGTLVGAFRVRATGTLTLIFAVFESADDEVCSGLMKPDTHLGENARQIEVSDDQTTPLLYS